MDDKCETVITKTGWGLCHYFLVGLCGICTLAEAGASLTVLIIVPLLACDLNYSKDNAITLNATSSLGMAFGAFFFGTFADSNGRKISIPITMVIIFCASIGLSFAQTYYLIHLSIFTLGMGVGGNNTVLRVYLIEYLPAKRRGTCLVIIDFFWVIGHIAALGIHWSLVPSVVRMLGNEFRPSSWRVLAGLGGAPSLVMACAASLLPPSPRYLLYRQNQEQALTVLQQMYAINNSRHADNYPSCELEGCVQPDVEDEDSPTNTRKVIRKYFVRTWRRIARICMPPYTRVTLLTACACLFLFPGFTWFALWDVHILQQIKKDDESNPWTANSTCTVNIGEMTTVFLHNCHKVNDLHFKLFLLVSLSYALGQILLAIGIDIIGRRIISIASGLVGGTALLTPVFAWHFVTLNVLSVFFLAAYSINYTTAYILLLENYPTSVRGTAMGLMRILPSMAGFFVKFFMNISCLPTIYIASGLLLGATIAAIPIPDLVNAPMRE